MGCDDAVTNTADFINPTALPSCPAGSADEPRKPLVAVCCGTTTRKVASPAISKLALFRCACVRARYVSSLLSGSMIDPIYFNLIKFVM